MVGTRSIDCRKPKVLKRSAAELLQSSDGWNLDVNFQRGQAIDGTRVWVDDRVGSRLPSLIDAEPPFLTMDEGQHSSLSHDRLAIMWAMPERVVVVVIALTPRHSSIETVHEDDLNSLDRIRNTSVDGPNQGLESREEPEIDRVDCTSSGSDDLSDEQATSTISSFDAKNLVVGPPLPVKEGHIARQNVIISTSIIYETTIYVTANQAASAPLSTSKSPTLTSPTPTSSHSTTSSTNSSSQCDGVLGTDCQSTTSFQTYAQQSPPTPSSYLYQTLSTSSDVTVAPTSDTSATMTMTSPHPVLASGTVSSSSTVMVSSPLAQSTSVPDTNSGPQPPPYMAAIVGGAVGAVALLALLIFIAIWYRRKRQLSVTPFTLTSTTRTAQNGSEVWLKSQSIGDAIRPNGRGPSSIQHSDACLVEHPGNGCPSFVADSVSSHLPDDDDPFASVIVLPDAGNMALTESATTILTVTVSGRSSSEA
ncbi:hypothetical protein BDR05DRAFT_951112 [Suillus weaverae]|nr:hypothetical protein BDR05DRAFT_951112 [Suillus weaverae]